MALDEAGLPGYAAVAFICQTGDFEVYEALSPDHEQVLLKVPAPSCQPAKAIQQLEHELEAARDLDPAFAVRPLRIERAAGHMALVLEGFACHALSEDLTAPLELGQFFKIAIRAAEALAALHRQGLVHKDIKPENIFLNAGADGAVQVKLTGFGVASRLSREGQVPAPPEAIAGTLAYMAPEQSGRMNRSVDSRSDLYALGVTFYQMLTGRLPFTASDPMEWVHCHVAVQPSPPRQHRAEIPEPLSDIVIRLLAKNAEERYQTAEGLKADLERCLRGLEETGTVPRFQLGLEDVPRRLPPPRKLYNREKEAALLAGAFERACAGGCEFVLVSGAAGTGKTALVREIQGAVLEKQGYFVEGKFDQLEHNAPYRGWLQAFDSLVSRLLTESEAELATRRQDILGAIRGNGQVLTSVIQNLELIIGPQPDLPELGGDAAQNRFNFVFLEFLRAAATAGHPLAVFLDDLQWIDGASLRLLHYLLTGSGVSNLLIIGAYRGEEVDAARPLKKVLNELEQARVRVERLEISPLSKDGINVWLADCLVCAPAVSQALADLLWAKTAGNPFFTLQILQSLEKEGLLTYSREQRRWTWDAKAIGQLAITDNVVDLVSHRIRRLPPATLAILERAACLGTRFDLDTLSASAACATEKALADLRRPSTNGLSWPSTTASVSPMTASSRPSTLIFRMQRSRPCIGGSAGCSCAGRRLSPSMNACSTSWINSTPARAFSPRRKKNWRSPG